jgi:hypothetical protein
VILKRDILGIGSPVDGRPAVARDRRVFGPIKSTWARPTAWLSEEKIHLFDKSPELGFP